jgi:uncharacterized protein (TIGR02271 family)
MPAGETIRLFDRDGHCARLALPDGEDRPAVAVLESGAAVRVPLALMVRQDSGTYSLAARFDDLPQEERASQDGPSQDRAPRHMDEQEMVIPAIAEEAHIHKERRVTGKVRLRKIVHHEEQTVDEPLLKERVSMERVAIDRWVDEAPPIRSEGETLVVPVVEEVLVVEKRLRLREEIRLTWHHEEEHEPQHLVVRREEVLVERLPNDEDADGHPGRSGEDTKASAAATGNEIKP